MSSTHSQSPPASPNTSMDGSAGFHSDQDDTLAGVTKYYGTPDCGAVDASRAGDYSGSDSSVGNQSSETDVCRVLGTLPAGLRTPKVPNAAEAPNQSYGSAAMELTRVYGTSPNDVVSPRPTNQFLISDWSPGSPSFNSAIHSSIPNGQSLSDMSLTAIYGPAGAVHQALGEVSVTTTGTSPQASHSGSFIPLDSSPSRVLPTDPTTHLASLHPNRQQPPLPSPSLNPTNDSSRSRDTADGLPSPVHKGGERSRSRKGSVVPLESFMSPESRFLHSMHNRDRDEWAKDKEKLEGRIVKTEEDSKAEKEKLERRIVKMEEDFKEEKGEFKKQIAKMEEDSKAEKAKLEAWITVLEAKLEDSEKKKATSSDELMKEKQKVFEFEQNRLREWSAALEQELARFKRDRPEV